VVPAAIARSDGHRGFTDADPVEIADTTAAPEPPHGDGAAASRLPRPQTIVTRMRDFFFIRHDASVDAEDAPPPKTLSRRP